MSTKFEENRTKTVDFYYWSVFDPVANSLEQSLVDIIGPAKIERIHVSLERQTSNRRNFGKR